jgi:hypothetical protein
VISPEEIITYGWYGVVRAAMDTEDIFDAFTERQRDAIAAVAQAAMINELRKLCYRQYA